MYDVTRNKKSCHLHQIYKKLWTNRKYVQKYLQYVYLMEGFLKTFIRELFFLRCCHLSWNEIGVDLI